MKSNQFKVFICLLVFSNCLINSSEGKRKNDDGFKNTKFIRDFYNGGARFDAEYFLNGIDINNQILKANKIFHTGRSISMDFVNDWENIIGNVNQSRISVQCLRHMTSLINGISSNELSSFKCKYTQCFEVKRESEIYIMFKDFDSWAKFPSGILRGHFTQYGSFDECLDLKTPQNIIGKYCFVNLPVEGLISEADLGGLLDLKLGICMPKSCSTKNFEEFYKRFLKNLLSIDIPANVSLIEENTCSIREKEPLGGLEWFAM